MEQTATQQAPHRPEAPPKGRRRHSARLTRRHSDGCTLEQYGDGVHTVRAVLRYDHLPPELKPRQLRRLAVVGTARSCTIDDALEALLAEARV